MSVFEVARGPRDRFDRLIMTPGSGVSPMQDRGTIHDEFAEKWAKNRRPLVAGTSCKRWQSLSWLSVGRSVFRGAGTTFASTLKDVSGENFGKGHDPGSVGSPLGLGREKRLRGPLRAASRGSRFRIGNRFRPTQNDVRLNVCKT